MKILKGLIMVLSVLILSGLLIACSGIRWTMKAETLPVKRTVINPCNTAQLGQIECVPERLSSLGSQSRKKRHQGL